MMRCFWQAKRVFDVQEFKFIILTQEKVHTFIIHQSQNMLRKQIFFVVLFVMVMSYSSEDCPIIGIDLGSSYSCVGVFKNGQVEIIPNQLGNRITPSVVTFTDDEILIGQVAKAQVNPSRTIYDVKRFIGRRYSDPIIQQDRKNLPYSIVQKDERPYISIPGQHGKDTTYAPQEISAMILSKMKAIAESYIGEDVKTAIVSVPAYFDNAQRQATKDAGTIAGFNVIRVLNQPTAAAIAYGLEVKNQQNILVFDLGGRTFDVSILAVDDGVFEILSTHGDAHLGGQDFNLRVLDHFIKLIKDKEGKDISDDKRAIQTLTQQVEKAKRALSSQPYVNIEIENLFEGYDLSETLTRTKFEEMNYDLFEKTLQSLKLALQSAVLGKSQIDEIILVGGSARIPKIRQIVKEFFDGKEPLTGIKPEETVCYGAAVQGGVLCSSDMLEDMGIICVEVTPLSLGFGTVDSLMNVVIPSSSLIPSRKSQIFTVHQDNQQTITIQIYEGEERLTKDNRFLGSFEITGIPPQPKGPREIQVTFEIDQNSILSVNALEKVSNKSGNIVIESYQNRLSDQDIEKMIREASSDPEIDLIARDKIHARQDLDNYLYSIRISLKDRSKLKLSSTDRSLIQATIQEGLKFIDDHPDAQKQDYENKRKEIEEICDPIIQEGVRQAEEEFQEEVQL